MSTMLHWSPTAQFHFHHPVDETPLPVRLHDGVAQESSPKAEPWHPATEGRIEDGTYVIQFALPGLDPKDVKVSLLDGLLTVQGESKADHDPTGKKYFVREVVYGAFERRVTLPEGVDPAQVEAKYTNGILEVRVPTPRAAQPKSIEVKIG